MQHIPKWCYRLHVRLCDCFIAHLKRPLALSKLGHSAEQGGRSLVYAYHPRPNFVLTVAMTRPPQFVCKLRCAEPGGQRGMCYTYRVLR